MSTHSDWSRRDVLAAAIGLSASIQSSAAEPAPAGAFPKGFLWGAATAGHQVEGNDVNSDVWLLENLKPTIFAERAGDACDSFNRWPEDLDLVRSLGLNSYRFSLEWSRIEPDEGQFSNAMLDYYKAIISGCRERGLTPVVTFNHFAIPRWFAARGGWDAPSSAGLFARYCERTAKALAAQIGYATTLNEPQLPHLLRWQSTALPTDFQQRLQRMFVDAGKTTGSEHFASFIGGNTQKMDPNLLEAHKKAYNAIKSARPDLSVGVNLAIDDDQEVNGGSRRDEKRRDAYGSWMDACKSHADFVGVQNYGRQRIDASGPLTPLAGAELSQMGTEVYPASLEGAIRYAYEASGRPVLVTENGIATTDDSRRVAYIPDVVSGVLRAIQSGVPVLGYIHWSLLDNFEWIFGYTPKFGLVAVDRLTQQRTPKASAQTFGRIARNNGLPE